MNYYIDTEFIEGPQDKRFLGFKYGEGKPTIDLISIGIVSEDGWSLYKVSKDFDFRKAWADKWIRENVLKPIHKENTYKEGHCRRTKAFTKLNCEFLIYKYGASNKEIANQIKEFLSPKKDRYNEFGKYRTSNPILHGWYSAYDHVVLSQLFGRMVDLPEYMPMYTRDLKQMFDEKVESLSLYYGVHIVNNSCENTLKGLLTTTARQVIDREATFEEKSFKLKNLDDYPRNEYCHNALADARWNKKLHEFIKRLK